MKFFVFAAAILALSTASTLFRGGKTISVNDDGTILVTGETGKQVIIARPLGLNRNIEMSVVGPNIPKQTIQIDDILTGNVGEKMGLRDLSQSQILANILKENQGLLDEPSYELLLQRLDQAVKDGQISRTIVNLLQDLDIPLDVLINKLDQQIQLTGQQQDVIRQRISPINQILTTSSGLVQNIPLQTVDMLTGQQQDVLRQRTSPINQIPTTSSGLVQNIPFQTVDMLRRNGLRTQQELGVSSLFNPLLSVNKMMMMRRNPMMNQWTTNQLQRGLGINALDNQLVFDNEIGQQIPIVGINQIVPQTWQNRQQMVIPGIRQLVSGIRGNDMEQLIGSGINQNQVPQSWLIGQQQMQVPNFLNRQQSGVQVPQGWLPIMQRWMINQLPLVQQQQPIVRNILGNINQLPVLQQQWQQTPMVRTTLNDIVLDKLRPVQTLRGGITQGLGLGVNQQRGFLQNEPVNMMGVPQMVLN